MQTKISAAFKSGAVAVLAVFSFCGAAFSQQVSVALLQPMEIQPSPMIKNFVTKPVPPAPVEHRFWDRENRFLFGAVAGFCAADFAVTHANLQNGGRELNPLTRPFAGSTAGLAANFAGETVGVIGLSYFFHKTGHHKLERMTSVVNIGASAFAVGYGLAHR